MGKKSLGKNETSKGERKSSIGYKNTDPAKRLLNQIDALAKGKNVIMRLPSLVEKNGKKQPDTLLKVNGREWLARREGKKEHAE